jgi:RNA polymerase-binding transcription factor DksA
MASAEKWVLETGELQSEKDSWSQLHSGTEQFTSIPLTQSRLQVTREGRELVDESALDVANRAVNSATKEFLFRQAHDRHQMLHLVETALDRIRYGNFGECLACGGLIGLKRLEAVPWTEYCGPSTASPARTNWSEGNFRE